MSRNEIHFEHQLPQSIGNLVEQLSRPIFSRKQQFPRAQLLRGYWILNRIIYEEEVKQKHTLWISFGIS